MSFQKLYANNAEFSLHCHGWKYSNFHCQTTRWDSFIYQICKLSLITISKDFSSQPHSLLEPDGSPQFFHFLVMCRAVVNLVLVVSANLHHAPKYQTKSFWKSFPTTTGCSIWQNYFKRNKLLSASSRMSVKIQTTKKKTLVISSLYKWCRFLVNQGNAYPK